MPSTNLQHKLCWQGVNTSSKATQKGKASSKTPAAAAQRKKQPVVLSSSGESDEEEEESSSDDESEHLEIERVLHGRPNAETQQEEFLVKIKGEPSNSEHSRATAAMLLPE